MIERNFDVEFVAGRALREKQIQQNYRPVIAVHKWFARRPGTLFRGLILSEFCDEPLPLSYYRAHSFEGIHVADPFMGGGTPLLEANRVGCDVIGCDINPMSYWIVRQEVQHLDLAAYDAAASDLREHLQAQVGHLYRTRCLTCGSDAAHVKYYLWVKTLRCGNCGGEVDLFPRYLVARNVRHPRNVVLCCTCGGLNEIADRHRPGSCSSCASQLVIDGPARRNRCACPKCGHISCFPNAQSGPPRHRLFAIEYHCPACRSSHEGRFFKTPDTVDNDRLAEAEDRLHKCTLRYVPDEAIPAGDETNRLHRWGYTRYPEMFNARQLLGLELSARFVAGIRDERVRDALATNLSDLLRYQNMLCRYDTMALKSLDIFSVHGFPVGLVQCESNLLGIAEAGRPGCVGSGGWANVIQKFRKAKAYCDAPFEIIQNGRRKTTVPIVGEWIGDAANGRAGRGERQVQLWCADSASLALPAASLDAVFTDPPYLGNVQYAELMDFCYVWLRRLVGAGTTAFAAPTTRSPDELTGNESMGRGLEHFTGGLSATFRRMAQALKPGAPLAFTYHHNDAKAYHAVAVAVLDAGLACSASLPCPAEMGASIHISGTHSSIIDTVFVCRSTGRIPSHWVVNTAEGVARLVEEDVGNLERAGVRPTKGDLRCIAYGHLTRLAIWWLRRDWEAEGNTLDRLSRVADWFRDMGDWPGVERQLHTAKSYPTERTPVVRESAASYGEHNGGVSF
jgi:adenine-specific DNA methylase